MTTPWVRKYQPRITKDILGQDTALLKIKEGIAKKKILLLYGPTGTGKTTAIHAIGKENNLEVFEVNSSDTRNKGAMETVLGNALKQKSLFSKGKIILIDDIDAVSGQKDRGGLAAMTSLFEKNPYPIVLTCIDPWDEKFSIVRKKATLVGFQPIKKDLLLAHLKSICEKENVTYTEETLDTLAKESRGDVRAAINDLQTHSLAGTVVLEDKGERDKEEDMIVCLRKILKNKRWEDAYNIFDKTTADINECFLWIDENLPKEYRGEDLKKAYHYLSRADVFNGRIRRQQHWRFLVYINMLLTAGIATAKKEANPEFIEYTKTSRILKMWIAKNRNAKKRSIAEKIAEKTHMSKKRAFTEMFPYLKSTLNNEAMKKELELDEEEIEWLKKRF